MHLLYVNDHMRRFDPGTDFPVSDHAFLLWRDEEQRLPSGMLCAIVEGVIGSWDIKPFGNRRFIKNIDQLPGVSEWLDRQSGTRFKPNGLDVHHRSDFHDILRPVENHVALMKRYELMCRFMRERFGTPVWQWNYQAEPGRTNVDKTWRDLAHQFVEDLLQLQAA